MTQKIEVSKIVESWVNEAKVEEAEKKKKEAEKKVKTAQEDIEACHKDLNSKIGTCLSPSFITVFLPFANIMTLWLRKNQQGCERPSAGPDRAQDQVGNIRDREGQALQPSQREVREHGAGSQDHGRDS